MTAEGIAMKIKGREHLNGLVKKYTPANTEAAQPPGN